MFVKPKMGMSFPRERDLEAKLLSQYALLRVFLKVHYPSISRYILDFDFVICLHTLTTYDIITCLL